MFIVTLNFYGNKEKDIKTICLKVKEVSYVKIQ